MKQDNPSQQVQQLDTLYSDVRQIIETSRSNAVRSVDFCRVQMYWHMGQRIFEEEQQGKERADYGAYLLQNLAKRLEPEFGSGFGYRQLKFCRQFYRTYPNRNTLCSQLNWSQYRALIKIEDSVELNSLFADKIHIRQNNQTPTWFCRISEFGSIKIMGICNSHLFLLYLNKANKTNKKHLPNYN